MGRKNRQSNRASPGKVGRSESAAPSAKAPARAISLLVALGLALATVGVYAQVRSHQFISCDDNVYVTGNDHVKQGLTAEGFVWAFTTHTAANWHPLTWLSLMLDAQLFHMDAGGFHLVSLALHVASTLLLFYLLRRMTGAVWPSALAAALFALHPLHVESVAWVAERKDTLSMFLFLLTVWAYVAWTERRGWLRYLLVVLLFGLGLLAKPMLVTLPLVLLLLDYWPLGRLSWRAVLEKLPLLALTVASCVVTFLVQHGGGAVVSTERIPVGERIETAIVAYGAYLWKTIWPTDLSFFYYRGSAHLSAWPVATAAAVILVITLVALREIRRRPYLAVGWFWYLGTLVPVIGLVQVGEQSMADRYTYLPLVGIFVMIAWSLAEAAGRWRAARGPAMVVGVAAVVACGAVAYGQVEVWKNTDTICHHALSLDAGNPIAHLSLADTLIAGSEKSGDTQMITVAIEHYQAALRAEPRRPGVRNNLGIAYNRLGQPDEAIRQFRAAIAIDPDQNARRNLAMTLFRAGHYEEAVIACRDLLAVEPDSATAEGFLAAALHATGHTDEAIPHLQRALTLKTNDPEVLNDLGIVCDLVGKPEDAIRQFRAAIALKPKLKELRRNLAHALTRAKHYPEAVTTYRDLLILEPDSAEAEAGLALALVNAGHPDEAISHFRRALALRPGYREATLNLSRLLATCADDRLRDGPEAVRLAERAVQSAGGGDDPHALAILAAAYAEAGRYDEAVRTIQQAIALAQSRGNGDLATALRNRMELYRSHHPYHESAMLPSP